MTQATSKGGDREARTVGPGLREKEMSEMATAVTRSIRPKPTDRVLEIGAGTGDQTVFLAGLVEAVFTVEIDPRLARKARARLKALGCRNVHLRVGDGHDGWIEEAPFDSIVVTGAVEDVPPALMDQLKDGGRMVLPLGTPFGPQELTLVEKHGRNVITRSLTPARFVSFRRKLA